MTPPRRILVVDDERPVLDGLKKALRPHRQTWQVEVAEGGAAAIARLKTESFDAVVSDARMPEVDGEQVLKAAREFQPLAIRVVLSGQVERTTGHRLASVAHQFLAKPSDAETILLAITDSCRVRDVLETEDLKVLVGRLGALPLAPSTYLRLTELLDSPDSSLEAVVTLVEQTPALSATVLRLVSSAYFGMPRRVASVREAVVLLGMEVLRQVVLMAEVFHESDAIGLLETVQHRALIRSKLARLIAAQAPVATLAAEAALLADLGVYLLALRRPDSYRPLWETYAKGEAPLQQLEQAAMSSTHAEVGAALLGLWNLPPTIVAAVAHHHVPPEKPLTLDTRTIVNLAALLEDEAVLQGPARAEATAELQRIAGALSLSDRLHALRDVAATCRSGESGVSKPEGVPS